jgi:hypothetical protein
MVISASFPHFSQVHTTVFLGSIGRLLQVLSTVVQPIPPAWNKNKRSGLVCKAGGGE